MDVIRISYFKKLSSKPATLLNIYVMSIIEDRSWLTKQNI
uniref:Uncharacterized protein n=1 Tax=Arundo donax TaxID=35708 RepID=A0A0A9AGX7_ARUDO